MCSEIDHCFSSFLRRMSGSDNPNIFPLEKNEGIINSETTESHPQISAEEREREKVEDAADHQKEIPQELIKDETDKATASQRETEDEDGFRTPTSSDHRIPAITQCPPAPKKLRPPPPKLKRKASPGSSRTIQLDSSPEVESIFCNDQNDAQQQKIKKPRTDSDDKDRP